MEKRKRRRFTAEYKGEAVQRREESDQPLQAVADGLGVRSNQLRGLAKRAARGRLGRGPGAAEGGGRRAGTAEPAPDLISGREVKRPEQENGILEKATASLAREAVAS